MSIWQFANRPVTVLAAPLSAATPGSSEVIAVATATGFPLSGLFAALIEAEIVHVTGVAGTAWTVVRGAEGTAAVAHLAGKPVVAVLTAEALAWIRDNAGGAHVHTSPSGLTVVLDGGGAALTTGVKLHTEVPFNCTIDRMTLLADQGGSAVLALGVQSYAAFDETTVGTSIVAAAPPTLAAATKAQDAILAGWTTALTAGQLLGVGVTSATTVQRLELCLHLARTI